MSTSSRSTNLYRVDIRREIRRVYMSKHRELYREFDTLEDFEKLFFRQDIGQIDDNLSRYLNRGYNYLDSQAEEGFVDFTHDDENIDFNSFTNIEIRKYLAANSLAHLYAHLALLLMDTTDIEDHLNHYYHLIKMSLYYMTFENRR